MILALVWTAHAAVFVVDVEADRADALPGDGICADATGACPLRAAVMEGAPEAHSTKALPNMPGTRIVKAATVR